MSVVYKDYIVNYYQKLKTSISFFIHFTLYRNLWKNYAIDFHIFFLVVYSNVMPTCPTLSPILLAISAIASAPGRSF